MVINALLSIKDISDGSHQLLFIAYSSGYQQSRCLKSCFFGMDQSFVNQGGYIHVLYNLHGHGLFTISRYHSEDINKNMFDVNNGFFILSTNIRLTKMLADLKK